MKTIVSGLHKLEEHVSRIAALVIDELGISKHIIIMNYDLSLTFHLMFRNHPNAVGKNDGSTV